MCVCVFVSDEQILISCCCCSSFLILTLLQLHSISIYVCHFSLSLHVCLCVLKFVCLNFSLYRSEYQCWKYKKKIVMWLMWCMICHLTDCFLVRWHVFCSRLDLEIHFWRGVYHKWIHVSVCVFFFLLWWLFKQIKNPGWLLNFKWNYCGWIMNRNHGWDVTAKNA